MIVMIIAVFHEKLIWPPVRALYIIYTATTLHIPAILLLILFHIYHHQTHGGYKARVQFAVDRSSTAAPVWVVYKWHQRQREFHSRGPESLARIELRREWKRLQLELLSSFCLFSFSSLWVRPPTIQQPTLRKRDWESHSQAVSKKLPDIFLRRSSSPILQFLHRARRQLGFWSENKLRLKWDCFVAGGLQEEEHNHSERRRQLQQWVRK